MPRLGTRKLYYLIKENMAESGIKLGRDALFDYLRREHLLIKPRKNYTRTTYSNHWLRKHPNLYLDKEVKRPEEVFVSDITYIKSREKTHYLSLVTDAFSRKIVGHHLSDDMSAENVNSESESDVGQPTISHASTEAINDSSSESGALVEEDSSPSVIKLVLIIVVFFGLLGATGFGGWKAYLAYIENSKAVDVSSLDQAEFGAVSTNLSGVNKDTTVEIATPDTTLPEPNFTVEVDYQVNPVGGPNNSEFSENSNTEDKPSNRGITQEQYENLLSKLEAYDSRIDKVLNNQSLLTQQINRSVSGITDSVGDSNGFFTKIDLR